MSYEEAEQLMDNFEKWDAKSARKDFLARMEHKLRHKENFSRR